MPNKKVLLISPQAWGKMFVAKHHYAVELARSGNEVYFLNPPVFKGLQIFRVERASDYPGMWIVDHGIFFPLMLRFRFRKLYDALMRFHVGRLVKKLGVSFDIVWCFEPNLYKDLEWFQASKKIYHPVDELFYDNQFLPGKNADLVISVTNEILAKFREIPQKKLFVNHGISREFAEAAGKFPWHKKEPVTVGYSGNLLRTDIDFETIKKCIQQFTSVKFIFWGNYKMKGSNLEGNKSAEINDFIDFLKQSPNVELKGVVSMDELVTQYQQADIFIICYNINKDQSKGTNYHKVMEFFSTGKVIVSNNITTYHNCNLLRMCSSRNSNREFTGLLNDTIEHLDLHNNEEQQEMRKEFASRNTYKNHVLTIEQQLFNEI